MPARAPATPGDAGWYAALLARDARFDGRVFVGVTSTGIYCRPVCRVRTPLQRNCRFFAHAAAAESAGFRPCLRCRPELAPGLSLIDSPLALAHQAARVIDAAAAEGRELPMPAVAARLGVTDRHLRRIFGQALGVSPLAYLNTRRLLHAKALLTDTPLSVTAIAHASGFGSLRRFNAAFAQHYRLSPSALRQRGAPALAPSGSHGVSLTLGYRPPYDLAGMGRFLANRALPGIEEVLIGEHGLTIRRSLALTAEAQRHAGWIELALPVTRPEVRVQLSPGLIPVLGAVLQRVRHALDLDADPSLTEATLADVASPAVPGLRLPGSFDSFESAVRVILGQQVTVAAARTLCRRLVEAFGEPITTPHAGLDRLFPAAPRLAEASADQLGRLGIVRQRVGALQALARAVAEGRIELHPAAPLEPTLQALRALPGIGEWTVQLIALRVLGWPDAFAASDIGVLNALGTRDPREALARAEAWRPWRAYAVIRLWQTLEKPTPEPQPAISGSDGAPCARPPAARRRKPSP
ncbi:MAG: helix-turn-helix domain-containing protein [Rubrivivax sp.]|nr:helix-turn-helix domain-containing protein [Rubrivivax sp.]